MRFEYDESIMPVVWYRVGDEGVARGLQVAPGTVLAGFPDVTGRTLPWLLR